MITEEHRPQVEAALAHGVTELTETLAARGALHALDDWRPGPDIGLLAPPSRWPDSTLHVRTNQQVGACAVFAAPSDRTAAHALRALEGQHETLLCTDVRELHLSVALDDLQPQFRSFLWHHETQIGGYVYLSPPDGALPAAHSFTTSEWAAAFWAALVAFPGNAVNRPSLRSCVPGTPAPVALDRSGRAVTQRIAYATSRGVVTSSDIRYTPNVTGEVWIINGTPIGRSSQTVLHEPWIRRLGAYVAAHGLSFAHATVTEEDSEPVLLGITSNPFSVTNDDAEADWLGLQLAGLL